MVEKKDEMFEYEQNKTLFSFCKTKLFDSDVQQLTQQFSSPDLLLCDVVA